MAKHHDDEQDYIPVSDEGAPSEHVTGKKIKDTKVFPKETLTHAAMFRVACEVGRVQMSYEELSQLEIGQVVPFENTAQLVHLTVDGTRVGEGMLVEVDGKVGVKITRWYR